MIKLIELKSSNIKAAGHDPSTNVLKVQFSSGDIYEYQGVPADVASGLMQADSPGRFFQSQIRGQYTHEPVVADEQPAQA